ncbi:type 4a pilus biogenesis protein PilO [uncultured Abyssibacter sp.]|uniref:type 4a pilus biogenesis protein PilO n=1 Tax=uncultured Abyssibacter sp. TaxID=2320202 RepID=UPI0032B2147D
MNAREIFDELQGLDPNNPGAWPGYARIGAVILIMAIIIGAGSWYLVKPKFEQLDKVEAEETQLRKTFENKQKKIANLDAYKAQLEEMRRSFGAMLRQLPNRTEVANLLNDISQTRVASGLEEELFQPQGPVTKEFYAELPNKITVVGTYHEMGAFVSGVAALPRIVTIDQVEIRPAGGGRRNNSGAPEGELRMQALAKTFRYLDESDEEEE